MTRVMVVVASRHGATRGIADRIADRLRETGHTASVFNAEDAPGPESADAVVIGGAAYMGKWLEPVTEYVHRHRLALSQRPTWLFASGPVGPDKVDKQGHDVLEPPPFLREVAGELDAQGMKVFFGRWDPDDPPATVAERLFRLLPISREVLPVGDFRDWPAIDAWAREIASELEREPVAAR